MSQGHPLLGASAAVLLTLIGTVARAQEDAAAPPILTYQGADREQKLLDGARKEGEVVFYSAMITNQALRPITAAFQKKYPDICDTYAIIF